MDFTRVVLLADGWLELGTDHPGVRVLLKIRDEGGRGVISGVVVLGDSLDSTILRSLPLARIEAAINHPRHGISPVKLRMSDATLRDFAARGELFPDEFGQIDAGLTSFLAKQPEPYSPPPVEWPEWRHDPLGRPDGTDPDAFSRRVAEAYKEVVLTTSKPAKVLAEEAGVPVTTVHRWIREARLRGHLPATKKGRAG